jgi:cellulose synthase/poly-beta-1,6-N-acetylglucosamine synthase-like glycosyltransferase
MFFPKVTFCLAAYNEENAIQKKIDNIRALDYPQDLIEIIIASDGSSDKTVENANQMRDINTHVLSLPRGGKNNALNRAVECATAEILVFTDVDALCEPSTLRNLVQPFSDSTIGAVLGDYRYRNGSSKNSGERLHWGIDRILKKMLSSGGNATSASGALYAIRKNLYRPVPKNVADDFYISTQAVSKGYRIIFEPTAVVYGETTKSSREEYGRKVRIITKGLQGLWEMKHLLNPFRYGFYSLQLFTHKFLRRMLFIPIILLFFSSALQLEEGVLYQTIFLLQLLFHSAAALGALLQNQAIGRIKPFSLPFFIDLVYFAALMAVVNILRGKKYDIWTPPRK